MFDALVIRCPINEVHLDASYVILVTQGPQATLVPMNYQKGALCPLRMTALGPIRLGPACDVLQCREISVKFADHATRDRAGLDFMQLGCDYASTT